MSIPADQKYNNTTTCAVPWCEARSFEGRPCQEHWKPAEYVAATGDSYAARPDSERGAVFPMIGVGLGYNELDGDPDPTVTLHVVCEGRERGQDVNADLALTRDEARRLKLLLEERLALLEK